MKQEIDHELYFEPLPTEPVEKRPMATKSFKEFRTLAFYSTYLVARSRLRRGYHGIRSGEFRRRIHIKVKFL